MTYIWVDKARCGTGQCGGAVKQLVDAHVCETSPPMCDAVLWAGPPSSHPCLARPTHPTHSLPNVPAALWLGRSGDGLGNVFCQHRGRGQMKVVFGHGGVGGMVTGVGLLALDKALHEVGAGDFGEGSVGHSAEQGQGQQHQVGTASWSGRHTACVDAWWEGWA